MKQKFLWPVIILILVFAAFYAGRSTGISGQVALVTRRDLELHKNLAQLDQTFLTNLVARPNSMVAGVYTLEVTLAGQATTTSAMPLNFVNGQMILPRGITVQDLYQTGNVVSWERYDIEKGPSARFVGIIDGNTMWGRIYVEPGRGWREGEPAAYGTWRLYRQPVAERSPG